MKIIKWALMGLGALFICGMVAVGWVAWDSRETQTAGNTFIGSFLNDFSRNWEIADVETRVTPDNVAQLAREPGMGILRELAKLGRFKSIENLTLVKHLITPQSKSSTFDFVGIFENGSVFSRFTLINESGQLRVKDMGFQLANEGRRMTDS